MRQILRYSLLIFYGCLQIITASDLQGQLPHMIFAPVFVGRPTDNAFNGLVGLQDGELRHYGFEGPWSKPSSHICIYSIDNGLTWERKIIEDPELFTNENMPPAVCSPYSGDFIRLISTDDGTYVCRSSKGIDGPYQRTRIDSSLHDMIRQPVFLKTKKRILVTCGRSFIQNCIEVMQSCVYYSDDDGLTWTISYVPTGPRFIPEWPHKKPRWQNYAIEPTIAELSGGKIWMLLRTSMDVLYESFSTDHGSSWTDPSPSRFYSTLTMPTFYRLKDGRLLLLFCDSTPLPEEDRSSDSTIQKVQRNGLWEDVFTNRDVIHAAISDDDGKTWLGFREFYLDPLRNEKNFATIGGTEVSLDKSVHQSQALELPDGNVLVALGQHPLVRALVIFDPDWLYDTTRSDNFESGLKEWTTFKYINGIKGHCAYNRDSGPVLIKNPCNKEKKVLQIRHLLNPELVCDVDGAVWNFPAGLKGSLTVRMLLQKNGRGGRIYLTDRWFNPTDTIAHHYAMYNLEFDGKGNASTGTIFPADQWTEIKFEWDDLQKGSCRLIIDGNPKTATLPLICHSINGINYVHFQSADKEEDKDGFMIESVKAIVEVK
jgi:hypothetical protein